ncbi:Uncharacterised protein [Mycobacteroides abscessus subsp. abscessus]|nr:Uncharacterised protein [Mycobacteroides abscessus subsp. abscessus]
MSDCGGNVTWAMESLRRVDSDMTRQIVWCALVVAGALFSVKSQRLVGIVRVCRTLTKRTRLTNQPKTLTCRALN